MTIGKKIGTGFCVVIILTLVLGLWAVYSMRSGADVATEIARDRLPRFTHWTQMQNDLLEASYYAQVYFAGGTQGDIDKTFGCLDRFSQGLKEITGLNTKIYYTNTANALKKAERDLGTYSGRMKSDVAAYVKAEDLVVQMSTAADDCQAGFGTLIKAMTVTLESFIDGGNDSSAKTYARNLAAANAVFREMTGVYQDLLTAERNNDLEGFTEVQERLPQIRANAIALDKSLLREECHVIFKNTLEKYDAFAVLADQVADTIRDFLSSGRARYALFREMYKDTIDMVKLTTSNSGKFTQRAVNELNNSTFVVSVLLGIVTLLAIGVALAITRTIVKPLAATKQFAEDVAAGQLDKQLNVNTNDETGKVAAALRTMVASLRHNISAAQEKSEQAQKATERAEAAMNRAEEAARQAEQAKRDGMLAAAAQLEGMVEIISSASTQLSAQIEQSDKGAAESAQRLQEAATAMNEMNATVQEVARNAGSAADASSETSHKAKAGQNVVHEVVSSMAEVHESSMALKDDMAQLNERAQDINRIMGVISDIADQTNLLALNAAIEAARAGEAGRGFAVVADEVRKLAEKTMTSTQDVSHAIHAIQESTGKSMAAMDAAVGSIGRATELANESGGALEDIVATVEATSDQVRAIAAAAEEQSAASEEINKSITEVNDMSRMTADAMREASVAVSDLANQAQKLNELIGKMKQG